MALIFLIGLSSGDNCGVRMDSILTEFLQRTNADPSLAQDLLEAVEWNLDAAVSVYSNLHDTKAVDVPEYEYDPSKPMLVAAAFDGDAKGVVV